MEIPKIDKFAHWLFADDLKEEGHLFEFVEFKTITSKKGNEIPCFILLGENKQKAGEFQLSLWNINNLEEMKTEVGNDTDTWKGKRFNLTPLKSGKIVFKLENDLS